VVTEAVLRGLKASPGKGDGENQHNTSDKHSAVVVVLHLR
jgi:hypothetical protein